MMKLPPLRYSLNNVVIGWREEAVAFANQKNYDLIVNDEQRPFVHFFRHEDVKSAWYTNIFDLGMKSKLPIPFDIQTIGLEDGALKVITKQNSKILIDFKFLHVFDTENCVDLGLNQVIEDHRITDLFDITRGSRLGRDIIIKPHNSFIQEFRTIRSNRIDRNSGGDFKDFVATSIVADKDIKSFDFSDTVIRLVLERKLKQLELKAPSGRTIQVSHSHRHIVKNQFSFEETDEIDKRIIIHGRH